MNEAERTAVNVSLTVAEAAGEGLAKYGPTPEAKLGGMVTAGLARIISGIVERHGQEGLAEARKLLEQLRDEGPQGITDAELVAADAALEEEIRSWYGDGPQPTAGELGNEIGSLIGESQRRYGRIDGPQPPPQPYQAPGES